MSKVFTIAEGLENMGALRTGGQGSVYKGRRIGPIISAVKLLPTPIHTESTDDKNYRNFLNEVDKLKKVNEVPNPNVVKILNSGITESGSFPFIEMEFIEGPDLEELLKPPHGAIFTIKETIKVADQLANALCHCHKVGVKHGDIKSNNVKFNIHSGNYILLDFGLSAMSDEQRRSSMRHAGAIEFMAPEQNEGKMLFQTDVYSYGVILYELLAGQVPFPLKDNGETARNTVMIAHMESALPDLIELRRQHLPENWTATQKEREMQVPGWLLDLIADCLEKLPENRYINGMQLQEAIIENSIADINAGRGNNSKVIQVAIEEVAPPVSAASYTPPADTGMINLSKPVFYGFMVLLFVFMALAGYSLFSKSAVPVNPVAKTVVDTPKTIDSEQVANEYYARKHREKQKLVDSTTLNAIKAGMNPQTHPDSTVADTSSKPNN
ncbi:serine/threonine-protein kinase [uncultured Mucilaginibacter sp.]|uniref:serine/threonine protein kinase n=1 Tax=uncultured Mucilaginibacter sp. TaxID=797541 RepID=UPI0025EB0F99|nr:serine/threonine-protein kinase [uncultured Mucilaginibacter sp.]